MKKNTYVFDWCECWTPNRLAVQADTLTEACAIFVTKAPNVASFSNSAALDCLITKIERIPNLEPGDKP